MNRRKAKVSSRDQGGGHRPGPGVRSDQRREPGEDPGPERKRRYAGIINGRNVWKADQAQTIDYILALKRSFQPWWHWRKAVTEGAPERWSRRLKSVHFTLKHAVRQCVSAFRPDHREPLPYEVRRAAQQRALGLPALPTCTRGSFPQTTEIRQARYDYGQGRLTWDEYWQQLLDEIKRVIELQDDIGLDVLVHGEVERNDMIQYFAELMEGYAATQFG